VFTPSTSGNVRTGFGTRLFGLYYLLDVRWEGRRDHRSAAKVELRVSIEGGKCEQASFLTRATLQRV